MSDRNSVGFGEWFGFTTPRARVCDLPLIIKSIFTRGGGYIHGRQLINTVVRNPITIGSGIHTLP